MFLKCCLFVCVWGTSRNIMSAAAAAHLTHLFHSLSLCYLNIMNQDVSASEFSLCISPLLDKQRVFCWSQLQCLHQLFQSVSHLSQLTVPPVPSHRKWGIRITHGGYEKGICFTVAGDGAAEGVTWGWNERQPSTREENYEHIAAGFELRLIRSAGRRHRAGVFSHNMSSAEPQIGRPARRSDWLTCLSLTYLKEIGQSARPLYQSYDLSCLTQI